MTADIQFHFDPVCGWAWLTSKWVRRVAALRGYSIEWRMVSLRLTNRSVDYDARFPSGYVNAHDAGLRLLRVVAAVRKREGQAPIGALYEAITGSIFDVDPPPDFDTFWRDFVGTRRHAESALARVGLDESYADALDNPMWDELIAAETDEILALTGTDVGTPLIRFHPPDGPAFFGPVISYVPSSDPEALHLWDAVITLAAFSGFSELKRSLRPARALRVYGTEDTRPRALEDWHQGSRKWR